MVESGQIPDTSVQTVRDELINEETLRDKAEASRREQHLGNMGFDLYSLTYDTGRILKKDKWAQMAKGVSSEMRRKLREFRFWNEAMFARNFERLMEPLTETRFGLTSDPVKYVAHISNRKLDDKLISGRHLTRNKYPEGFDKYIMDAIKNGEVDKLRGISDIYWKGTQDPSKSVGSPGTYPLETTTQAEDVFMGTDKCVFLAPDFAYRNVAGEDQYSHRFGLDTMSRRGAVVSPMDTSVIIQSMPREVVKSFKSDTALLEMALGIKIDNTLDFDRWIVFFRRYCECVFDSEDSMQTFLSRFYPSYENEGLDGLFDLTALSSNERERVKRLLEESGVYPPFANEILVRNSLPISEAGDVVLNDPYLVEGKYLRLSDALGSNKGFVVRDKSDEGAEYYVKLYEDANQGHCEDLANRFYREYGVDVCDSDVRTFDGKVAYFSRLIDYEKAGIPIDLDESPEFRRGFVVDAFLGNIDAVRQGNVIVDNDGRSIRMDNGSSFGFRARGERREFGSKVSELETMRKKDTNYYAYWTFRQVDDEVLRQQIGEFLSKFPEDKISELVREQVGKGMDARFGDDLISTLLQRRKFMFELISN